MTVYLSLLATVVVPLALLIAGAAIRQELENLTYRPEETT